MIFFAAKEKTEDLLYQAMSFMEKKQPKNAIGGGGGKMGCPNFQSPIELPD